MSKTYNVRITSGTAPGPYNIYYDSINPSNLALLTGSETPSTGLTISQMTDGVGVIIPDTSTSIILYNVECNNNITETISLTPTPTPTLTPTITPTLTPTITPTITPTLTLTPTQTITPTITPTPEPLCNCTLYDLTVEAQDILNATGNTDPSKDNTVFYRYQNCDNVETTFGVSDSGTFTDAICVYDGLILGITYFENDIGIDATSSATNTEVECCP